MGLRQWSKRTVSKVARAFVTRVLPFVVTPVAIGAGITAGAMTLFFDLADDIRSSEGVWRFDHDGLELADRIRTPLRTTVMRGVSNLARPDIMTWIGLGSLLAAWWVPRHRVRATLLAIALGGGGLLIGSIKYRYARTRPNLIEALATEGTFSFPSGHAFISVIFYGILASWAMRRYPEFRQRVFIVGTTGTMIALIGGSRVYLGVHYPSDVLAGYAVAVPWLTACLIAHRQFELRGAEVLALPDLEED